MNYMDVPIGATVPFLFDTFAAAGGSVTLTGLATTDIKILKGAALTAKPTPTGGVALLDTDGIDLTGGGTGIHGFSVDTSVADGSFWTVGSYYNVIVDSVTIDSQTVRFLAGAFRLLPAETVAGHQKTDSQYVQGANPETSAVIAAAVADLSLTGHTTAGTVGAAINNAGTKTAFLPSATAGAAGGVAIVGSAMTLTTGERTSIADAHLDRVDGIETALTPRGATRLIAAALAGQVSGAETSTIVIRAAGVPATMRLRSNSTDVNGNRPSMEIFP